MASWSPPLQPGRQVGLVAGQAEGVPAVRAGRVAGRDRVGDAETADRRRRVRRADRGDERRRARATRASASPAAARGRPAPRCACAPHGARAASPSRCARSASTAARPAPSGRRGSSHRPQPGGGAERRPSAGSEPRMRPRGTARTTVPDDSSTSVNACVGSPSGGVRPASLRHRRCESAEVHRLQRHRPCGGSSQRPIVATSRRIRARMDECHRHGRLAPLESPASDRSRATGSGPRGRYTRMTP